MRIYFLFISLISLGWANAEEHDANSEVKKCIIDQKKFKGSIMHTSYLASFRDELLRDIRNVSERTVYSYDKNMKRFLEHMSDAGVSYTCMLQPYTEELRHLRTQIQKETPEKQELAKIALLENARKIIKDRGRWIPVTARTEDSSGRESEPEIYAYNIIETGIDRTGMDSKEAYSYLENNGVKRKNLWNAINEYESARSAWIADQRERTERNNREDDAIEKLKEILPNYIKGAINLATMKEALSTLRDRHNNLIPKELVASLIFPKSAIDKYYEPAYKLRQISQSFSDCREPKSYRSDIQFCAEAKELGAKENLNDLVKDIITYQSDRLPDLDRSGRSYESPLQLLKNAYTKAYCASKNNFQDSCYELYHAALGKEVDKLISDSEIKTPTKGKKIEKMLVDLQQALKENSSPVNAPVRSATR